MNEGINEEQIRRNYKSEEQTVTGFIVNCEGFIKKHSLDLY